MRLEILTAEPVHAAGRPPSEQGVHDHGQVGAAQQVEQREPRVLQGGHANGIRQARVGGERARDRRTDGVVAVGAPHSDHDRAHYDSPDPVPTRSIERRRKWVAHEMHGS